MGGYYSLLLFYFVLIISMDCEESLDKKNSDLSNLVAQDDVIKFNKDYEKGPFRISSFHRTILLKPPAIDNTVTENVIESQQILIKDNASSSQQYSQLLKQPEKGSVVDWFLGLVGIHPPVTHPLSDTPIKDCPVCTCGKTYKHIRIVGGIETMVNEYPWMTALLYEKRFYCGGSLINNKYILTAAHCVDKIAAGKISAVFLDHDKSSVMETQTIKRNINSIVRYKSYGSGGSYNNDIALLQLDKEVQLTEKLKPVCLPPLAKSFTGCEGIVTGWGATKQSGQTANKLQVVKVPIMSNIDCRKTGYGNRITDNMMCAGYPDGKKDSCQGDSGGPLHIVNDTTHYVAGIVSWGEGCAQPNFPGVYTRVNRYISWIKKNTVDACYC